MAKPKFEVGQTVIVIDTSNDREREGKVTSVEGKKIDVLVYRFGTTFSFVNGLTNLGRFKLKGW